MVDASGDQKKDVESVCEQTSKKYNKDIIFLNIEKGNSSAQRNIGLSYVEEEVIAFPDDDSLWYHDTAENFMKPYMDPAFSYVGGVNNVEVDKSPLAIPGTIKKSAFQTFKQKVGRPRRFIENALFPSSFDVHARYLYSQSEADLEAYNRAYSVAETLGGFRMTFRRRAIREVGFDETLGSVVGYAQHEDKDAALAIINNGWIILGVKSARVYHNNYPAKRGSGGFNYGFFQIFNYAYICRRRIDASSPASSKTMPFLRHKIRLYTLLQLDPYGRQVLQGAKAALSECPKLWSIPDSELEQAYADICGRHVTSP